MLVGLFVLGITLFLGISLALVFTLLKKDYCNPEASYEKSQNLLIFSVAAAFFAALHEEPLLSLLWLGVLGVECLLLEVAIRKTRRTRMRHIYG